MNDCVYCNSDIKAVRETYCNMGCASCIARHFEPPKPKLTRWVRFKRWMVAYWRNGFGL